MEELIKSQQVKVMSTYEIVQISKDGDGEEITNEHDPSGEAEERDFQNKDSEKDECIDYLAEEITRKSVWKHQSSYALDNIVSPLDLE